MGDRALAWAYYLIALFLYLIPVNKVNLLQLKQEKLVRGIARNTPKSINEAFLKRTARPDHTVMHFSRRKPLLSIKPV